MICMCRRACILFAMIFVTLAGCAQNEVLPKEEGSDVVLQGDKPVKVLLVGIDTRGEEKSRSDAILVAQINPADNSLKILSLMRDTYVRIPGYKKGFNKLNTAYYLGGKELLAETVKENFGIEIDHTVTVDFKGFAQAVNALAPEGIEVDVPQKIIDDMKMDTEPGLQNLSGDDLLKYVRFRHDDENDFGRVKRQQEVVVKLKEAFSSQFTSLQGIVSIPAHIQDVSKYIETDLSVTDMISLATMLYGIPLDEVETMTIPVPGGFDNKTYEHAGAVLQLDIKANNAAISEFFTMPAEAVN